MPRRSSKAWAARCWEVCATRRAAPISPPSCCRRRAATPEIIGLANAVGDTINSVKQATEFGIVGGGQRLAALLMQLTDVNALGLEDAQGLYLTEAFYWDLNAGTRAFADRFADRMGGRRPPATKLASMPAPSIIKAVKAAGTTDGMVVAARMKEMPTDDPRCSARASAARADGRAIHDMLFFEVKTPCGGGPLDFYKLVKTIPASEAFRPLDQGGCPLVTK